MVRWTAALLLVAIYCSHFCVVNAGDKKKKKQAQEKRGPKMAKIPARTFTMGGDALSGAPKTKDFSLQTYQIDETPVTNKDFRAFVKDTKFKTEAEAFGWSFVLNSSLSDAVRKESQESHVENAPHWVAVVGAYWRRPEGRDSSLDGRWDDYPAVHISWNDAKAYCEWAGKRLPSEAEWENAARGKRKQSLYPWGKGDAPMGVDGSWMMNIWQGDFPVANAVEDGYHSIAPVRAFPANSYGLYSMVGNIWEWCVDPFPTKNPQDKHVTLKGGSFIDSIDGAFNHKATVITRMGNTADSGSYNTGFRCAVGVGGGARKPPPDQEKLAEIAAEGGVEALQEFLGDSGHVMKAADLEKMQERLKAAREDL